MLTDSYQLFLQALNTMNAALAVHKDSAWFKRRIRSWKRRLEGRKLGVAIFNGNPHVASDHFTISLNDDGFVLIDHAPHEESVWKVNETYLKDVAARPQYYIENPDRLDWNWMENQLTLQA